jgi:hypothetical protein
VRQASLREEPSSSGSSSPCGNQCDCLSCMIMGYRCVESTKPREERGCVLLRPACPCALPMASFALSAARGNQPPIPICDARRRTILLIKAESASANKEINRLCGTSVLPILPTCRKSLVIIHGYPLFVKRKRCVP